MKKSNHQANIVRIAEVSKHPNADTLDIIKVGGYQVVSKQFQFNVGDLAVYIQPDSVVPQTEPFRFIWGPYAGAGVNAPPDPVSEKRRRITVRKFRGEWSEGLLLPLSDFPVLGGTTLVCKEGFTEYRVCTHNEGDDVSDVLGITHYDPDQGVEGTKGDNAAAPRRKYPKTLKGWFYFLLHRIGFKKAGRQLSEEVSFHLPVYAVEAFKNYKDTFTPGETVCVTEKIHGSNARFVYIDGNMYAGSRNFWKAPGSNCVWRKALIQLEWISDWCKANPGYALYGEVVPTQKGFNYGCKPGEVKFFVFDICTPDGYWLSVDDGEALLPSLPLVDLNNHRVPCLYKGPFKMEEIETMVDGNSWVPYANHTQEGIVVKPLTERRVPGLGRVILKLVSNRFLEKDSK